MAPRVLLLDSFVRLHRIDANQAGDVSAILAYQFIRDTLTFTGYSDETGA